MNAWSASTSQRSCEQRRTCEESAGAAGEEIDADGEIDADSFQQRLKGLLSLPGDPKEQQLQPQPARLASGETEAAVLVPIYTLDKEPYLVLTRRHAGLRRHAGEISFPGGKRDAADETLLDTALREAEEEIGLPRDAVQPLGALPPISTHVTNYLIHPFVGWIRLSGRWVASPLEVDAILELPLKRLRDGLAEVQLKRSGITFATDAYTLGDHVIWGATARIIRDLLARVQPLLSSSSESVSQRSIGTPTRLPHSVQEPS